MNRNKSAYVLYIFITFCIGFLLLISCGKTYDFNFDVTRDETTSLSRSAVSIGVAPFCQFSKYEMTLYFVHMVFYEVDGKGYSRHTILNRDIDHGIKVDLANEKLSDKIQEELQITGAEGNGVDKIYIGIGDTITINGYVYRYGKLYRTTSNGFVAGEGTPEDMNLPVGGVDLIPAWDCGDEPPVIGDLHGIYLLLAQGGHVVGNDDVIIDDMGTLEFRFPIDIGVVYYGRWESCNVNAGTPYVEGSTIYEKYYLKRVGEPYYTDMIRFLFDKHGHLINGQCWGYPFDYYANNVFKPYDPLKVWFSGGSLKTYNQAFGINADGSIYFDSRVGYGWGNVYAPAFIRGNHTGTMTVYGEEVAYECIKVE